MLEGVVTNLLNAYLGQFLEGLDADQMKISVWAGDVNLHNVRVKPSALDFLHLPITVRSGSVDKLHISADWRHLGSKPVLVELSGLYVVAVPATKPHIDNELERQTALSNKLAKLQATEDLRFGQEEGDSSDDSYMGKMTTKILDNVEIILRDVHIRYEDYEGPHSPTSFGVALEELRGETTDSNWTPTFHREPQPKIFKSVTLTNLFMYMNVNDQSGVEYANSVKQHTAATASAAAVAHASAKRPTPTSTPAPVLPPPTVASILLDPQTSFLLRPVCGFLRMWLNKATHPSPRIWVDSQLFDISFQLSELQYIELLSMVNRISASHNSMQELLKSFPEFFRPGSFNERKEYVILYKKTLNALWMNPLTPADEKRKEELEERIMYEDLRIWRLAAIAELKRELGIIGAPLSAEQQKNMKDKDKARASIMLRSQAEALTSNFFSKLGFARRDDYLPNRFLDEKEKETVFANVDVEGVNTMEELPKEYVHMQLRFLLSTLGFILTDKDNNTIAALKAEQSLLGLTLRDSSVSTILTIGDIKMQDQFTTNTLFPSVMSSVDKLKPAAAPATSSTSSTGAPAPGPMVRSGSLGNPISPGQHVLQLEIHSPPLDDSCDLRIAVRAKAPRIVIQKPFADRMIQFFTPPHAVNWGVLAISFDALQQLQGFNALNLAETLQNHRSMDISLDIAAPTIILPFDPTSNSSDVLVIDLGRIKLNSRVQPRKEQEEFCKKLTTLSKQQQEELDESEKSKCYDIYNISVKQVQVYLTNSTSLMSSPPLVTGAHKTFVLTPFDAAVNLWMCMSADVLHMPDIRVLGDVPLLQVTLSNTKYTRLMKLLARFENILALFLDPPIDPSQLPETGDTLFDVSKLQTAQQLFMRRLVATDREALKATAPAPAASSSSTSAASSSTSGSDILDLAALTRLMNDNLRNAQALMAEIDTDKNNTISRKEFEDWLEKRRKARELNETLELAVQLQRVSVVLSTDTAVATGGASEVSTDILEVRIDRMGLQMKQSTFQLKIGLVIGGLSAADLVTKHELSKYIVNANRAQLVSQQEAVNAVETSLSGTVVERKAVKSSLCTFIENDEFINISVTTTSDLSPRFQEHPVEIDVRMGFGAVLVNFEPETVNRIGMYITTVFVLNSEVNDTLVENFVRRPALPRVDGSPPKEEPVEETEQLVPRVIASGEKRAARSSVMVATHFESLKVQLFSKNQPIIEAVMENLHSEAQLYQRGTLRVFMQLTQIYCKDNTPAGAKYPYAITTRATPLGSAVSSSNDIGDEAALIRLYYDTYHPEETDFPGHREALQLYVQGLEATFLQRLVWEVYFFITASPVADFIEFCESQMEPMGPQVLEIINSTDITTATAVISQDYATLAASRYIKLNVIISGVDLIIPQHSSSSEYVKASIGRISVDSQLLPDADNPNIQYQQIQLTASAFQVTSLIDSHGAAPKPILDLTPSTIVVNVMGHLSRATIDVQLQALSVVVAPAQWNWCIGLTQLNLAETATIMKRAKRLPKARARGLTSPSPSMKSAASPSVPSMSLTMASSQTPEKKSTISPTALVFKLSAGLEKISFLLTENSYEPSTGKGSLASFELVDIGGLVSILANGSMDLASHCGSMSMRDLSEGGAMVKGKPILPEYRQLLLVVKEPNASSRPSLHLSMNKKVDDQGIAWNVIDASIANFRFNLGPIFLRLPSFFAASKEQVAAKNAAILENLSTPSSAPPVILNKQAVPATPSYVVLKLHLANPVIQFVRDPTARVSEAILLTFGAHSEILINNNSQESVSSAEFKLSDFTLYTTQLDVSKIGFVQVSDDPSVSAVILQRFGVHGNVKLTTPYDSLDAESILHPVEDFSQPLTMPTLRAHVVIDPIAITLSYQTYRLALRTLDALSRATSAEENERLMEEAKGARAALEDVTAKTIARHRQQIRMDGGAVDEGDESQADEDGSSSSSTVAPKKQSDSDGLDASSPLDVGGNAEELESQVFRRSDTLKLFRAEDIAIEFQSFDLHLINDATGIDVPIVRFQMDHCNVQVHAFAHQRTWRGTLSLNADYYNQSLVLWEPMLEQYRLKFDLSQSYILSTEEFNKSQDLAHQIDASSSSSSIAVVGPVAPSVSDRVTAGDITHSGAVLSTKLLISSPGSLNLNVTATMFRGVMDCLDLFNVVDHSSKSLIVGHARHAMHVLADQSAKGKTRSSGSISSIAELVEERQHHAYRFENFTELTLFVSRHQYRNDDDDDDGDASGEEKEAEPVPTLQLDPNSFLSFDFPKHIPLSEHELVVNGHKDGYGTIGFSALLRKPAAYMHTIPLPAADGEENEASPVRTARVVFEVKILDGVKVCRLRSLIGMRNTTSFPLEFKVMDQSQSVASTSHPTSFPVLQPGDDYFFPLLPTHDSGGFLIQMRPRNPTDSSSRGIIASEFGWSSPVILLADYSRQNQYFACPHLGSADSGAAAVGAKGNATASASPVVGGTGDFNCSVFTQALWREENPDEDQPTDLSNSAAASNFIGQTYVVGPAMLLQNLLAENADVRIVEKHGGADTVHWTATVPRGEKAPVHTLLKTQPTYIQVRIQALETLWSGLLALPDSPPEGTLTSHFALSVFDAVSETTRRELKLHLEVHSAGCIKIILYVPFWVYDLTHLGLVLSADKKQTVPLGPYAEFRNKLNTDVRSPVMFNFPQGHKSKFNDVSLTTVASIEAAGSGSDVQWSSPVLIDKIGVSVTTTITGPRRKFSPTDKEAALRDLSDVGINVTQAVGKYRRTKLIHLTPHYIMVSKLSADLEFMQRLSNNPELVHQRSASAPTFVLKAGEQKEFHWMDYQGNRSICFRRMGDKYQEWRWSGDLDPSSIGDLAIMVRHKADPNRCWFVRVEIHVQNATIFLQFSEFDTTGMQTTLPYRIQNHCTHQNIRVRQYIPQKGSKELTTPVPQCDWLNVNSYSVLHFAPEVPIYSRPCKLEVQLGLSYKEGTVVAERTVLVDLDEIKTHHKLNLNPVVGDEGAQNKNQTVFIYTESDNTATNILQVSNFPSADSLTTLLQQKDPNISYKGLILRQRVKRCNELIDMKAHLEDRIKLLNMKLMQELNRVSAASKSNAVNARPVNLPPRDSALVLEIKSVRKISMDSYFVVVQFDGMSNKTALQSGSEATFQSQQLMYTTSRTPGSTQLKFQLMQSKSMFQKDVEKGSVSLALFDLEHEPRTSWLSFKNAAGEVVGELNVTLWHVPRADTKMDQTYNEVEAQLDEKKRIYQAVTNELASMRAKQMINEKNEILPVHLQNDVVFKLRLSSLEGLDRALASMHSGGDVVCRIRSESTGKTASFHCWHAEPDHVSNDLPPLPGSARGPEASASSVTSASASAITPTNKSEARKIEWPQEISIYIPEELLEQRDEVVHLSFYFHPNDVASEHPNDAELESSPLSEVEMVNAGLMRATRLRANCPPIPLAHTSLPLSSVPVEGSKADIESQTQKGREKRLINWRANRIPLICDVYKYTQEVWLTLNVVKLEAKSEENRSQFCVNVELPQLSLSLIDAQPREVLFFSINKTYFSFDNTLCTQDTELKIDSIQLDNQTVGALFPVVLGFSPVEAAEKQPMVQLSVAKKKTINENAIHIYEYASLLIQQLDVKIEEALIYDIIRFVNTFQPDIYHDDDLHKPAEKDEIQLKITEEFEVDRPERALLFFELLQIQPIAVNVSFEASPGLRSRMKKMKFNPMELLLSVVGTAMGSIQAAPLRLNGRTFEHARGSAPVLIGSLAHHYKSEIISEAYKVVGSFEFLGNPVAAVKNIGTGVFDFFYLPAKGSVQSPGKFGIGLAKGSISLVKGTMAGIFGTVGSITGSVSKGLAIASMDENFIENSALRQQNAPKNAAEGLFHGTKSLAGGIFKGITGIVTDPYKGAKEGGAGGFLKGVGKGLLGVVAKPTSGAVGFASQTLTGIGNTANYLSDSKVGPSHIRPQRYISPILGLEPFDLNKSTKFETELKAQLEQHRKGNVISEELKKQRLEMAAASK